MKFVFSKRLDAAVCELIRNSLNETIPLDRLFLSVMEDMDAYGSVILNSLLRDWEADRILARVEHAVESETDLVSCADAKELKEYMVSQLAIIYGDDIPRTLNTGHLFFVLVGDRRLNVCRIIERYAVTPLKIFRHLVVLPPKEDYLSPSIKYS